jgi:hypothetical protein
VLLLAVVGFMQRRDWAKGRFMVRFSKRATQAARDRGAEIIRQARRRHVSGSALIERGCWMTSVSTDPLVIHATARLAVGDSRNGETGPREGPWIGSAGEPRKQHEAETSRRQGCTGGAVSELPWFLSGWDSCVDEVTPGKG